MSLPTSTKAIVLRKDASGAKDVFHDAIVSNIPIPPLQSGQVLVKLSALAFNRRDLWLRMGQYPGLAFDKVMGADGVGEFVQRVIIPLEIIDIKRLRTGNCRC